MENHHFSMKLIGKSSISMGHGKYHSNPLPNLHPPTVSGLSKGPYRHPGLSKDFREPVTLQERIDTFFLSNMLWVTILSKYVIDVMIIECYIYIEF